MANAGVPLGDSYPTRPELRAQLRPYVEDYRDIGANKQSKKYAGLNDEYQNIPSSWYGPDTSASLFNPTQTTVSPDIAVKLTDIPTSSTNYARPRTVAAGYNPDTMTMTVVFRDGTFYNYYEVSQGEWINFSSSFSKGKPWLNRANKNQGSDGLFIGKPRGVADPGSVPPQLREALWRVARTQQVVRPPLRSLSNPKKVAGRVSGWNGKNPSTGGVNPAARKRRTK
jgi:hypothetical protein